MSDDNKQHAIMSVVTVKRSQILMDFSESLIHHENALGLENTSLSIIGHGE